MTVFILQSDYYSHYFTDIIVIINALSQPLVTPSCLSFAELTRK